MGRRQTVQNDGGAPASPHSPACCFCWCCCCSSSCITMGNEETARRKSRRASRETRIEMVQNKDSSGKPSMEEVQVWGQSFDKLIRSAGGRNIFREFLRTEFSEENMLFWLACEDLKREASKRAVEEKARVIYEDYISILSPKEVSLDSRVREVINRNMLEPTSHTFDDAQLQIYTLMHRDSYPRFLNSQMFKSLQDNLAESSSES
ncbi:regulator of G-protein signaling 20-like isoform X4 [Lethenteron reissneri]|uniref:regulator of G-protein signaling 20-like isoform X4 n=1 Tax=Lethenteron reissneri TaxID=7753 RepID=UPI002AB69E6F|nr:regulator of G-protein signaling 20-like isoform X4 [Lethenteron reissneri]